MVFPRVYYLACIHDFQALFLWQRSLCSYLFFVKCKLTRTLTDPVRDMNTMAISFLLQWLLVIFEPLASQAVICVDKALILWKKHMFFLTRSESWWDWLHSFIVIFTH